MSLITSNAFNGLKYLLGSNNDRYTKTPDLGLNLFNFRNKEQYISIDGNESEIFRTTPQLYAVIYKNAQMLSNGIFVHYDKNNEVIEDSDLVKFLEHPNPFQAKNEWLIQQQIQKYIYGNCFIYILKGSQLAEIPSALWNIAPKDVSVIRTGRIFQQSTVEGIVESYKVNIDENGESDETFEPREVLHRNIQDVDDAIIGISPFHALKMPISNIRGAYGFRNVLINEKGAIGMLTNQSKSTNGALPLTESERKKIEEQYARNYGISDKQRKILMTSASLKWESMSYPTKDMMLFEEISEDMKIIIDAYGSDEALFSLDGVTFENKKEAKKSVYQDTIIPEANDLSKGLTKKLGLDKKGERIELEFYHLPILQEDEERKSKILKNKADASSILLANGLYSTDEIKDIVNLD